jgi:hypothetical protein
MAAKVMKPPCVIDKKMPLQSSVEATIATLPASYILKPGDKVWGDGLFSY